MDSLEIAGVLGALASLPAHGSETDDLMLSGYMLRAAAGSLRIVTGGLALEFAHEDVIEVTDEESPESTGFAVPVRLRLKHGARLLDCSLSAAYLSLLAQPVEPFAYRVRKTLPPMQPAPRWRAIEQSFRELHGLE
jgi:hypothetical protein